jgi:hypothetical protein
MTLQAAITLAPAGEYVSLKSFGFAGNSGKSKRGVVQGFSTRSRSRLMAKISQIKKHHLPLFVTLTYPDKYPVEWEEFKADLHRFMVAIRKKYPTVGLIWKLEFQKRGAAHYHCMLWGLDEETAREYIPALWFKIAGHGDEKHLKFHRGELGNSPCVEGVRSWRGVKSYASKYLAKLDQRTENTGRFWGVVGSVPFSSLLTYVVDIETALAFRRAVARSQGMLRLMRHGRFGFWLNCMHPDWLKFIEHYETEREKMPVEGHPEFPPSWFLPPFYLENLESEAY